MSASEIPADLLFQSSHEWARIDGDIATIGISDHAQAVESVKAASDIYSPLSGEVVEVNPAVEGDPSLANTAPYGDGWIFKIKISKPDQIAGLLTPSAYGALIG